MRMETRLKPGTNRTSVSLGLHAMLVAVIGFSFAYTAGSNTGAQQASHKNARTTPSYLREFNPKLQPAIAARSNNWSISLKRHTTCKGCPSGETFLIEVLDRRTRKRRETNIANMTAQIDEAYISNEAKALVVGRASANTSVINIIDLVTGQLQDAPVVLRPSVSPERRFVAFGRFFPEHSACCPSFQYMVYDILGPPSQNRAEGIAVSNQWDAGIPVYPEGMRHRLAPNILNEETLAHIMASEEFFWLDERTFAFVDRWQKTNRLVLVDLNAGVHLARVKVEMIPTSQLIDLTRCHDSEANDFERWSKNPEALVYVVNIRRSEEKKGFLKLDLRSTNPCLRQANIDLPVKE